MQMEQEKDISFYKKFYEENHERVEWAKRLEAGESTLIRLPARLYSKVFFRMGKDGSRIQEATVIKYEIEALGVYAKVLWYDEAQRKRVEDIKAEDLYLSEEMAKRKGGVYE